MKSFTITRALAFSFFAAASFLAHAADDYAPGPDSKPQEGVPKGELIKFTFEKSKVFPGTTREVNVYVPAQYNPTNPSCLYVNQDGVQWNAPVVFDNLIHKKEMPVTIGVFVMHGRVKAADTNAALDRFNRSYEYDGLGDNYARFLIEELLPEVETMKTSDGRAIHISKNPNDRAIGGSSSGAICAFTAAWERPDSFRRVFSAIGTYVGLRGGHEYSTLIRKVEPKPLRIFLQDGENDLNIYAGDWWMANLAMERSLTFAGYEVEHIWGEGMHSGKHGTAIFPDAMRWLWKDWPKPVKAGTSKNATLGAILLPGEEWQLVSEGHKFEGPAVNSKGEVFFNDIPASTIYKVADGRTENQFIRHSRKGHGQHFGSDGTLYAIAAAEPKIYTYNSDGKSSVIAEGILGNDLVVAHNGNIYVTQHRPNPPETSAVWLIRPDGSKQVVDQGLYSPGGVTLSPDQSLLYVADAGSHWVYSYQIQPDGTLQNKQRYYWLHVPDDADASGANGMCVDRDGRLYVATRMGIQICDQAGRVNAILPIAGRGTKLCFGGEKFDTLYVTAGDKVFKRKLKTHGAHGWDVPNKPAAPRL